MRTSFRETLWFKKGTQDEAARAAAADDELAPAAVDLLPIEDRYADDGALRREDTAVFGVHSGTTEYLRMIVELAGGGQPHAVQPVDEKALIGDLKRGRVRILAALGGCAAVLVAAVALLV